MTDLATNPQGGEAVTDAPVDTAAATQGVDTDALANTTDTLLEADAGLDPLQQTEPDDHEEVDYEGAKYKVPKPLKDAILRQADYTRKTQETAEIKRALEGERQAVQQQAQFHQAFAKEVGQYHALAAQIAQFDGIDWDALAEQDPGRAIALDRQLRGLEKERDGVSQTISQKQHYLASQQQREIATLKEQAFATLQREIPGFNEETVRKIETFGAQTYGFTVAEFDQVADPRQVKVLHDAMLWREHQAKAQQAQRVAQGQRTAPANVLRGPSGQFVGDPNAMSMEQYVAARAAGKL